MGDSIMKDIVTIGEILIDLTQCGKSANNIPIFAANPGGAPANVAVAASRLNADTAFIGKVGNDCYGDLLKKTLTKNDVDITGVITDNTSNTTLAIVLVSDDGERSFSFYRNSCADILLSKDEINFNLLSNTTFLHFGSVSLTAEPSKTATIFAAEQAKKSGAIVTYDPNYRENLWENQRTAIETMKSVLHLVDILKISDEELPLLTGMKNLENGTEILKNNYGIELILVTLGKKGAYYRFRDETGIIPVRDEKVADTNGAGDTFFGAFLAYLSTHKLYNLSKMSLKDIKKAVVFSNTAASITVSRHGAIPAMPNMNEVMKIYEAEI